MFERFTIQARQVIVLAVEEARLLGHDAVGSEHLLLGLLREPDSAAARVLASLGIELEAARALVVGALGRREEEPPRQLPFTRPAARALQMASAEAARIDQPEVEPEHILLALVQQPGAGAAEILDALGADPEEVGAEIDRIAGGPTELGPPPRPRHVEELLAEDLVAQQGLEVGWRGRPIALAALGAAVLARTAFDPRRMGPGSPLQMQVLAHLALTLEREPASSYVSGEAVESLGVALGCDPVELEQAIEVLLRDGLVVRPEAPDDDRVAITPAGVVRVERWLRAIVALFAGWPPERPDTDDVTR